MSGSASPGQIVAELEWALAWLDCADQPIAAAHLSTVIDLLRSGYDLAAPEDNA